MAMTSQQSRVGANAINDHFQKIFAGQGVWNPGSIATAGEAVDTITIAGVALGDAVIAVSADLTIADLVLSAFVSAANTVTVSLANLTGGAVDLNSITVRVVVGRVADFPENASA